MASRLLAASLGSLGSIGSIGSLACLGLALVALPSCSSSSSSDANGGDVGTGDGGGDGALGPSADQACAGLAKARCQRLAACSSQDLTTRDGDEATCEAREKSSCLHGLAAPSTASTPSTAEACAAAIAASTCPSFLGNVPIPACAAKAGGLAAGASCAFASQCQSTFCAVPKGSACGICAPVPKVGDSCLSVGCGPDLHCGKTAQLCVAFVANSGVCDGDKVCDFGLGCVTAKGASTGTCQPLVGTEGGACDGKEQTLPGCDRSLGLWCPSTGKCAKVSGFAKGGEACGLIDPAATFLSCSSGACIVPTGAAGKGTCAATAAEGGACDIGGDGPACVVGTRCVVSGDAGTIGACVSASSCK